MLTVATRYWGVELYSIASIISTDSLQSSFLTCGKWCIASSLAYWNLDFGYALCWEHCKASRRWATLIVLCGDVIRLSRCEQLFCMAHDTVFSLKAPSQSTFSSAATAMMWQLFVVHHLKKTSVKNTKTLQLKLRQASFSRLYAASSTSHSISPYKFCIRSGLIPQPRLWLMSFMSDTSWSRI